MQKKAGKKKDLYRTDSSETDGLEEMGKVSVKTCVLDCSRVVRMVLNEGKVFQAFGGQGLVRCSIYFVRGNIISNGT